MPTSSLPDDLGKGRKKPAEARFLAAAAGRHARPDPREIGVPTARAATARPRREPARGGSAPPEIS